MVSSHRPGIVQASPVPRDRAPCHEGCGSMKKPVAGILCLSLCWLGLGCGETFPTAPVAGTVTYKGKPLTFGKVTFIHDESGRAGFAELDADGRYSLKAPV